MQKKTDRRVRKTKSQLKTGLAQLMREKSIREITVKELVDAVDINRSTFYLHYSDIPGLLAEVENETLIGYKYFKFLATCRKVYFRCKGIFACSMGRILINSDCMKEMTVEEGF